MPKKASERAKIRKAAGLPKRNKAAAALAKWSVAKPIKGNTYQKPARVKIANKVIKKIKGS